MAALKAIVPVAGRGTRLYPLTKSQPREMLPIGRKPCVQWIAEELALSGVTDILFVTGANKRSLEDHFEPPGVPVDEGVTSWPQEDGSAAPEHLPVRIYYTRQNQPVGLGDAIRCGRSFVGDDPFVVALGDSVIRSVGKGPARETLVSRLWSEFRASSAQIAIGVEEIEPDESRRYGIVRSSVTSGSAFSVEAIEEKPSIPPDPPVYAVAARYVFWPGIFDYLDRTIPRIGGDLQLTDAIKLAIAQGHHVRAVKLQDKERRFDVSTFGSYFRAFIDAALTDERYGSEMRQYIADIASRL